MSKMMRISDFADEQLNELTKLTGESKQKLLDKALASLVRYSFIQKGNEQYAALKKDKKAWKELLAEREEWDVTLSDGLDNE